LITRKQILKSIVAFYSKFLRGSINDGEIWVILRLDMI